ncbi:sporulation protein YunB [Bacillus ectoiniformans]|uniref:sporulation protein YunB n=1 Tax=Bacillus ectoiniformans TaxID=1494429 RepID=UPI0019577B6D|nr:sporulation protein YunB [Bacillus ectoiniformans]MBM7648558.1 sporulation protein YunB [Bacillus ectoiniformans]
MAAPRKWKTKRGPLPLQYVLLITLILFTFSTASSLWIINESVKPTLLSYAETETRRIAAMVISKAINKKIAHVIDINDIIETVPGDTTTTKFNTEIINRVLAETTNLVQLNLKEAEKGNLQALELLADVEIENEETENSEGIVYTIPLGQVTNNALLGNLGPKVPIRFHAIGDVKSDVKSNVKPYGINNAYVEVFIEVEVSVQIIVPFATKVTTVKQDIPVAMGLIHGQVPNFYNGGGNTSPSITVPAK